MTIGKLGGDGSDDFRLLADVRKRFAESLHEQETNYELSMGMSNDYEIAVHYPLASFIS